jgi:carboxymethylenebutenolidase
MRRRDVLALPFALTACRKLGEKSKPTPVPAAAGRVTRPPEGELPTVTSWEAKPSSQRKAVLLVHGAGGPAFFFEKKLMTPYPETLAEHGYDVFMPHYGEFAESIDRGVRVLRATIDGIAKKQEVAGAKVGTVGFSRGGFLACAAASMDARIRAVVDVYGGLHDEYAARAADMPPTLILHGEADTIVPVDEAKKLERLLARAKVEHEMVLYPGQAHGLDGNALDDSVRRMVGFFDAHLHV